MRKKIKLKSNWKSFDVASWDGALASKQNLCLLVAGIESDNVVAFRLIPFKIAP